MNHTTVRKAEARDVEWCLPEFKKFSKLYTDNLGVDVTLYPGDEHATQLLFGLMKEGVFLVAEKDNKPKGLIAAAYSTHPFNPAILCLTECFWWVVEAARKSIAGYLLLREFSRIGWESADIVSLSLLPKTCVSEKILKRFDFQLAELGYCRWQ